MSASIAENLAAVQGLVAASAREAGRNPNEITLVAVSKTHPAAALIEAVNAGQLVFGESYVQEAKQKVEAVKSAVPNKPLEFHLIGHLQRNKVKNAVKLFDLIQSVDSLALAEEIAERAAAIGKTQRILLQINLLGEEQKSGVSAQAAQQVAADILTLPNLKLEGLMYIGKLYSEETAARETERDFRQMADFQRELGAKLGVLLPQLSMGMSSDFELAIRCGASIVRVGSAIFGERN